jgi:hypothetical protein
MPTITYEDYIASLSTADQLTALDVVPVKQGAVIKTTSLLNDIDSHIAVTYVMPKALFEDATAADILLDIVGKKDVFVWKTDATLHKIYISDSSGATVELGDEVILYKQGDGVHLVFNANTNNWYSVLPASSVINKITYLESRLSQIVTLDSLTSPVDFELDPTYIEYTILRIDEGSEFLCTINAPLGYTIAGDSKYELSLGGETVHLLLSGTNYFTI